MGSRLYAFFLLIIAFQSIMAMGNVLPPPQCREVPSTSIQKFQFIAQYLIVEAELYLRLAIGKGIDDIYPGLIQGPTPIGSRVANLDPETRRITEEFGYEAIGNIRAILNNSLIRRTTIQRPLLNFSAQVFADFVNAGLNTSLSPPFDPYADTINYLAYANHFTSLTQQFLVANLPRIVVDDLRELGSGILGTVSGRVGVLRTLAYRRVNMTVSPYRFTLLRLDEGLVTQINRLGMCGNKDEALIVPLQLGAENRTTSNVISADVYSLSVRREEREVLRILYTTGNASRPGGIAPNGLNGELAQGIIRRRLS